MIGDSVGGGSLTKAGAGTLRLFSRPANTFAGDLVVSGGTLVGTVLGALGSSSSSRTIAVNSGGTLNLVVGNMFGGYTATSVPAFDVAGGTVSSSRGSHAFTQLHLQRRELAGRGRRGHARQRRLGKLESQRRR